MSDKSAIEWTEATWNPVTGCTKVSQGCKHCYAEREWPRLAAPRAKPNIYTGRAFTDVRCHPEKLEIPLRWQKPRRIFVNSMSDLFHEDVPDQFIDKVFLTMRYAADHVFQVLTKRPDRMRAYLDRFRKDGDGYIVRDGQRAMGEHNSPIFTVNHWPLPNVWLGVSCEDQATADERIPLLLQTPAAVRWVSAEPLLGPIDLTDLTIQLPDGVAQWSALDCDTEPEDCGPYGNAILDWVVVGGESGPQARPMHPDWVRAIRDQCQAAGVPFFFKQWGEWAPRAELHPSVVNEFPGARDDLGDNPDKPWWMQRLGKKAAGRTLDGRTWDEYPA